MGGYDRPFLWRQCLRLGRSISLLLIGCGGFLAPLAHASTTLVEPSRWVLMVPRLDHPWSYERPVSFLAKPSKVRLFYVWDRALRQPAQGNLDELGRLERRVDLQRSFSLQGEKWPYRGQWAFAVGHREDTFKLQAARSDWSLDGENKVREKRIALSGGWGPLVAGGARMGGHRHWEGGLRVGRQVGLQMLGAQGHYEAPLLLQGDIFLDIPGSLELIGGEDGQALSWRMPLSVDHGKYQGWRGKGWAGDWGVEAMSRWGEDYEKRQWEMTGPASWGWQWQISHQDSRWHFGQPLYIAGNQNGSWQGQLEWRHSRLTLRKGMAEEGVWKVLVFHSQLRAQVDGKAHLAQYVHEWSSLIRDGEILEGKLNLRGKGGWLIYRSPGPANTWNWGAGLGWSQWQVDEAYWRHHTDCTFVPTLMPFLECSSQWSRQDLPIREAELAGLMLQLGWRWEGISFQWQMRQLVPLRVDYGAGSRAGGGKEGRESKDQGGRDGLPDLDRWPSGHRQEVVVTYRF